MGYAKNRSNCFLIRRIIRRGRDLMSPTLIEEKARFVVRGRQRRREIEDRIEPLLALLTQPRIDESAMVHLFRWIIVEQHGCSKYLLIGFPCLQRQLLERLDQCGTATPMRRSCEPICTMRSVALGSHPRPAVCSRLLRRGIGAFLRRSGKMSTGCHRCPR